MVRTGIFALIILTFVGLSAILFLYKFRTTITPLDEFKTALNSLRTGLNPLSTIGCKSYTNKDETANQIASALVPISVIPHAIRDTTLYVFNADCPDSIIQSALIHQAKLRELKSANYYFVLANNTVK